MARARNIKPAFFTNDELADIEPLGRLLFIGLWTLADYKGDIEWRAKRIKAQVLPYDQCDVQELAINLDKSGFIRFYSDGDKMYCRVVNFCSHQNPHKNERDKGSLIPDYSDELRQAIDLKGLTINSDKSGSERNSSASDPADSLILNPDSLILNPDSLILNPEEQTLVPSDEDTPKVDERQEWFDQIWKAYPKRDGAKGSKAKTFKLCCGIAGKDHGKWGDLWKTVSKYAAWAEASGNIGTQKIQQTTTFFGKDKSGYLEEWSITEKTGVQNHAGQKPIASVADRLRDQSSEYREQIRRELEQQQSGPDGSSGEYIPGN